MKKYRLISLLFLFVVALPLYAQQKQKFHVVSFEENTFDMSAREKPTSRDDGTGVLYAIIKVRSTDPDDDLKAYDLDFDYLKDVQEMHDGVLWVYVQNGAKTVNITRAGYHSISRYDLRTTLRPGKVYDLEIKPEAKVVSMQYLQFKVSPADSKAVIMYTDMNTNEEKVFANIDEEGNAAKKLLLGRYSYRIRSELYHDSEGFVSLEEPNGKHLEVITLRPNFAQVSLTAPDGADIYINGERKGTGTWKGSLTPGTHSVECRKVNHTSSEEAITVVDGQDLNLLLKAPVPIVGQLSVETTPLEATVTVDGKNYGKTPLIIDQLIIGSHTVQVSKDGYQTSTETVTVEKGQQANCIITMTKGPEKGAISVKSSPKNAKLTIDGKEYGKTPYTVNNLLPGTYNLKLSKSGYYDESKSVYVYAGETSDINMSLVKKSKSRSRSYSSSSKVNFGITGSLGGFYSSGEYTDENGYTYDTGEEWSSFSGDIGALIRFGDPERSTFNFITGLKLQFLTYDDEYTSTASTQFAIPFNLNWNYMDGLYMGLGFTLGFELSGDDYYYDDYYYEEEPSSMCWDISMRMGFATRHHDFGFALKFFATPTIEFTASMGIEYTYYF